MKKIFRKALTVFGSALMVGSTIGAAAAANYPSPFVEGGSADVAIVYGSDAAVSDVAAAGIIQGNLASELASQTASGSGSTGSTVTGGDSFALEKTSQKFWLGNNISTVASTNIDDDDMPTLLAEGKYIDTNNEEYDYKQYVKLTQAVQYKMFNDNDYKKDTPSLGIKYSNGDEILNYTLEMTDKPLFTAIADSTLPLMGKEYYVLSVASTNDTLTLLDSAASATLSQGESTTLEVDGTSYDVTADYIDSSGNVRFTVNGETTNTMSSSAKTYKLEDGAYIGLKTALAQSYAGGTSTVEFSLGSGKLVVEDTKKVKLNDENVDNVYGYVENNSNTKLSKVILQWKSDDESFVAEDSSITLPGFETLKLSYGGFFTPKTEEIMVKAGGNDYAILENFPINDGTLDIPFMAKADGNSNFTMVGKDSDELVATANSATTITFDGSSDNYNYLVVSWTDGTATETQLIKPTGWDDKDANADEVDFEHYANGEWKSLDTAVSDTDEISLDNFVLSVSGLNSTTDQETVTLTYGGTDTVSFNTLYSDEGLRVTMPWINATQIEVDLAADVISCANALGNTSAGWPSIDQAGELGYSNINVYNDSGTGNVTCTLYPYNNAVTYPLRFAEENKDGDTASGKNFNVTISNTGSSDYDVTVTGTGLAGTEGVNYSTREETSSSNVYEQYIYSALATKFVEDDDGTQDTVKIAYHGGESYGEFYLTDEGAEITGGSSTSGSAVDELGTVTVEDTNVASVSGKNLVVVGGSCINSVAASLLGGAFCEADFTAETGVSAGEFLIESFDRDGKVALLVAGYNAADTSNAATYLINNEVDTTVGTKYTGTSATSAELVVE